MSNHLSEHIPIIQSNDCDRCGKEFVTVDVNEFKKKVGKGVIDLASKAVTGYCIILAANKVGELSIEVGKRAAGVTVGVAGAVVKGTANVTVGVAGAVRNVALGATTGVVEATEAVVGTAANLVYQTGDTTISVGQTVVDKTVNGVEYVSNSYYGKKAIEIAKDTCNNQYVIGAAAIGVAAALTYKTYKYLYGSNQSKTSDPYYDQYSKLTTDRLNEILGELDNCIDDTIKRGRGLNNEQDHRETIDEYNERIKQVEAILSTRA
jgi:hypothetical protein